MPIFILKYKGLNPKFRIITGTLGFCLKKTFQNFCCFQDFFFYLWRLFEIRGKDRRFFDQKSVKYLLDSKKIP